VLRSFAFVRVAVLARGAKPGPLAPLWLAGGDAHPTTMRANTLTNITFINIFFLIIWVW
jgi:hypothetical protein